ncbi:virion protein US2 [Macacine alphaherpesvirus 1]|uniref:US2 protein n=2 Tax=Cercopithecine herpesvirus 1 TaxID=10325 RepID=Q8V727_CHV1|nr:virion protein US2 [Macacine alphaherpesvirus 1]AAP41479.1 tegument protein [Macacine alphaherpesvirus 1]ARS01923.1 virion protein US2 [Macacine alphaherpesvirus 1]ARS02881.1 virion protein US2 [Macacine alphaherpesvirus 1]BAB83749.1 US2 [Macacine alphaherpesvirus 1]
MGVVVVTVMTLLDRHAALPRTSADANPLLWNFLLRQCRILAAEPLGTPVVVRSADLRRVAAPLMDLPRPDRPVARTRACDCVSGAASDVFPEDAAWESEEVADAAACFRSLCEPRPRPRLYHLWVVGAADLCVPFLEHLRRARVGARLVTIRVTDAWAEGGSWPLPDGLAVGETVPWTPFPTAHNHPLAALFGGYEYRYGVVRPNDVVAAAPRPRGCMGWLRETVPRLWPGSESAAAEAAKTPTEPHPARRPCVACRGGGLGVPRDAEARVVAEEATPERAWNPEPEERPRLPHICYATPSM